MFCFLDPISLKKIINLDILKSKFTYITTPFERLLIDQWSYPVLFKESEESIILFNFFFLMFNCLHFRWLFESSPNSIKVHQKDKYNIYMHYSALANMSKANVSYWVD